MPRPLPSRLGIAALLAGASAATALIVPAAAVAVPGPDSVAVVSNANSAESVALAESYAERRDVPARQVCPLDLPDGPDMDLDAFRDRLQQPLFRCLEEAGVLDRIEAVLLVRGVPLRVAIPMDEGDPQNVSVAAAVGLWRSEMTDGSPVLGEAPGRRVDCGGVPCVAASWQNPFREGAFHAGWAHWAAHATLRPVLVTMLHGRSFEEAAGLLESALIAEASGGVDGTFLLMDAADGARGVLDYELDDVADALAARGLPVVREPFASDLEDRLLAGLFTGTAQLGSTIEANDYAPGSLVDNVTSFGAVPANFEAEGEVQVSIARWVTAGVAAVHGTVDEPLNNAFPSRSLLVDWVDGSTLAETFHRNLPWLYWQNLVLGDPMAAPFAIRPEVSAEVVLGGEPPDESPWIEVMAHLPDGGAIAEVALFLDGVEVAREAGPSLRTPVSLTEDEPTRLLAVARSAGDAVAGPHAAVGWTAADVTAPPVDIVDVEEIGGCDCSVGSGAAGWLSALLVLMIVAPSTRQSASARLR